MMANASCRKGRRLEKVEISTAVQYRETIPSIEGNTERQFASRFRQLTRTACNCAIALVTAQHESAKCRPHDQPRVMRKAIAPEEGDREHDEIEVEHAWHSEQACEPWCGGPQFKCGIAVPQPRGADEEQRRRALDRAGTRRGVCLLEGLAGSCLAGNEPFRSRILGMLRGR
jgi:hypothetical protein